MDKFYVLRLSNRMVIACFPYLSDAIKYSEQIINLKPDEYRILKSV